MVLDCLWLQAKPGDPNLYDSARQYRKLIHALTDAEGILGVGAFAPTPGPNLSVNLALGFASVTCDTVQSGGRYLLWSDATVNVPLPAAPGSGSRTHRIVVQLYDPQADGSSTYSPAAMCLADVGQGTPPLPQSALNVATVTVLAGQSTITQSAIVDLRTRPNGQHNHTYTDIPGNRKYYQYGGGAQASMGQGGLGYGWGGGSPVIHQPFGAGIPYAVEAEWLCAVGGGTVPSTYLITVTAKAGSNPIQVSSSSLCYAGIRSSTISSGRARVAAPNCEDVTLGASIICDNGGGGALYGDTRFNVIQAYAYTI